MGTTLFFILLYLLIVVLVIEISVVLFNLTAFKKQVSRYQAISMLTGTGFTTDESKLIIDHPVRRRISAFLILFGAFSLAVIISALSNMLSDELRLTELTIITSFLMIILLVGKVPVLRNRLQKAFHYRLSKWESPLLQRWDESAVEPGMAFAMSKVRLFLI